MGCPTVWIAHIYSKWCRRGICWQVSRRCGEGWWGWAGQVALHISHSVDLHHFLVVELKWSLSKKDIQQLWVQVMASFSSFPGEKCNSEVRKWGFWLIGKPWKQNSNCFTVTAERIQLCCLFWFSQNCYSSESLSGTAQSWSGKKSLPAKKQLFRPNLWIK